MLFAIPPKSGIFNNYYSADENRAATAVGQALIGSSLLFSKTCVNCGTGTEEANPLLPEKLNS